MKFLVETQQMVEFVYSIEAFDEEEALFRFHSGEAEQVDHCIHEEQIIGVCEDY